MIPKIGTIIIRQKVFTFMGTIHKMIVNFPVFYHTILCVVCLNRCLYCTAKKDILNPKYARFYKEF